MARDARGGFTLIEALVAFAIVAAATVVVQRSLVQSRLAVARAAGRETAEWIARDLLAEPLSPLDMSEGGRTGLLAGHRYEIRLSALPDPVEDEPPPAGPAAGAPAEVRRDPAAPRVRWQPVRVRILVETGRPDPLTVETVKLGRVVLPGGAEPPR